MKVGEGELERIRQARALARARAWRAGAAPDRVVLDFDATPISIHSEKEHAAGHYKGGFGFNPLIAACGREVLAGVLRPGNAGANNAEDHLGCWNSLSSSCRESALDGEILARSDSAGASHEFAGACRETRIRFSLGYPINETVREQILALGRSCVEAGGQPGRSAARGRMGDRADRPARPAPWPSGTRLICRRERPHPGAQLSFTDSTGTASSASSPTSPTRTSPRSRPFTASTPKSRIASRP